MKNLKNFSFKCQISTFEIKNFQIFLNSRAQFLLHKFGQIYVVKTGRRKRKILLIKKVACVNISTFEKIISNFFQISRAHARAQGARIFKYSEIQNLYLAKIIFLGPNHLRYDHLVSLFSEKNGFV